MSRRGGGGVGEGTGGVDHKNGWMLGEEEALAANPGVVVGGGQEEAGDVVDVLAVEGKQRRDAGAEAGGFLEDDDLAAGALEGVDGAGEGGGEGVAGALVG